MDVYHKVLHRLCEVTEGKNSKAVDFKDLVKKMGFHGNYGDIYKLLSGEGWITDSPKADFVYITHWGVAEVKKTSAGSAGGGSAAASELKKDINRAHAAAKDLTIILEEFAQSAEKEAFPQVEKKFAELQQLMAQVRTNLD